MPKRLNVEIGFNADTSQAKKQIQELNQALQNVAKLPGKGSSLFDDKELKEASKAALELQGHLQKAVDVNTGKLDLSRFSTSLKASGQSLDSYYNKLVKIGPEGQQAFFKIAQSISTAEAPLVRINAKMAEFGTAIKNAARWQISSSVLHGFMGSVQAAYGYAQDLNKSLNNIRIVTGQSTDEMARFAEQANKSAKALSTTTTAYTDAALIFYQQGLTGDDVTKRTDTVVKMANVTKQSAEEVSSYMTAIWNNFYDGSESLEHYADVITALGATTASSSAEIAEGLSKFASVADTIGLSYDYATSILSALVANTRQSADVIGTSLKTILARLQSVKLGETLEDGVKLTKYTQALDAIGVSVVDLNGNLRAADDILEDTAAKWETLNSAQQAAVAQTVAGTRQYAQFIAMMENWGDVQKNLNTAGDAEGTLQDQADIYAESWEAARTRVKAALQSIYTDLLDDKFFIGLANGFEKLLEAVKGFTSALGGMKGIVSTLGVVFLNNFAQKAPEALNNLKQTMMVWRGKAEEAMLSVQQRTEKYLDTFKNSDEISLATKTQAEGLARVSEMQQKLIANSKNLSESEREEYKLKIQLVQAMYQESEAIAKEVEELEKKAEAKRQAAISAMGQGAKTIVDNYEKAEGKVSFLEGKLKVATEDNDTVGIEKYTSALKEARTEAAKLEAEVEDMKKTLKIDIDFSDISDKENFNKARKEIDGLTEKFEDYYSKYKQLQSISATGQSKAKQWQEEAKAVQGDTAKLDALKASMKEYLSLVKQQSKESGLGLNKNGAITKLQKELDQLTDSSDLDTFAQKLEKTFGFNTAMDTFEKEIDDIREKIRTIGGEDALKAFDNAVDAAKGKMQEYNDSIANTKKQTEELPKGAYNASTAFTQFASATMAAMNVVNAFKNGIKTLGDALKGNASVLDAVGAAVSMLMSSMMALNAVRAISETLMKKESLGATVLAVKNYALGASSDKVTASLFAQAAGWIAAKLGMDAVVATMLVMTGIIAAVIAAFAGLVFLFKELKAKSPDGQFKKLSEVSKNLSKKLDDAKQSAENLKNAFNGYNEAVKVLKECTRGTEEWNKALLEVNNNVLDIIKDYPELLSIAGAITRNADGMLEISEMGQSQLLDAKNKQIETLTAASLMMSIQTKQTGIDRDVKAAKDFSYQYKDNATNQNKTGTFDYMSALQPYFEELQGLTETEFKEKVTEILEEIKPDKLVGQEFDKLVKSVVNCQEEIDKLAISSNEAKTAMDKTGEIIAGQELGNDYESAVVSMTGDAFDKFYNDTYDDLIKKGKKDIKRWSEYSSDNDVRELWDAYNEALGTNYKMDKSNGVTGSKNNRQFQYLDDGELKKVTLEEVAATIAAAEAMEQLGTSAKAAADFLNGITDANPTQASAVRSFITNGNFNQVGKEDFDVFAEGWTSNNAKDKGAEFLTNLANQSGQTEEEVLRTLGYNDEDLDKAREQFLNDIKEAYTATRLAFNDISVKTSSKSAAVGAAYDDLTNTTLKNASVDERRVVSDSLINTWAQSGEEGLNLLTKMYKSSGDKADEFAKVINDIDWSSTDIESLRKQLENAGVDTSKFTDSLLTYVNLMQKDVILSTDALTAKFKTYNDIIGNIKDGDLISKEQFDTLDEGMQTFFQMTADGQYQLIGNAEELKRLLEGIQIESFRNNINTLVDKNADYERIQQYDFDKLTQTQYNDHLPLEAGQGTAQENTSQQLDILSTLETVDQTQLRQWTEKFDNNILSAQDYDAIAKAVKDAEGAFNGLDDAIAKNYAELKNQQEALATSSKSISQLEGYLAEGTITTDVYNKALDNVTKTEASAHNLDYDTIITQAKQLAKAYNLDEAAARKMAIANQRMNNGIETLSSNWDTWKKTLNATDKTTVDYAKTLNDVSKAVAELVGANEDLALSQKFVEENMDLIEKASTGDVDAINQLGMETAKFSVELMKNPIDVSKGLTSSTAKSYSEFEGWRSTVLSGIQNLQDNLDNIGIGDDIYEKLGGDKWIESLNEMAMATGMSVEEMNSMLNSMGVEAEVVTTKKTVDTQVPWYKTEETVSEKPGPKNTTIISKESHVVEQGFDTVPGEVEVAQINTGDAIGRKPKVTYSGKGSASPSATSGKKSGGGGGSAKNPKEKEKKDPIDETPDRYHDLNETLQELDHELAMLGKTQKHVFGKELINNLTQQNKLLKDQRKTYSLINDELRKEQKELYSKDKEDKYGNKYGLSQYGIKFNDDEFKSIANYNEVFNNIQNAYNNAVATYNAAVDQYNAMSAEAQEEAGEELMKNAEKALEGAKAAYDDANEWLKRYDATVDELQKNEEKRKDLLYQQIENNMESYQIEIQIKLDFNEAKRAMAEFLRDMKTDIKNLYKTSAEWAAEFGMLQTNFSTSVNDTQLDLNTLADYKNKYDNKEWGREGDIFASESEAQQAIVNQMKKLTEDSKTVLDAYKTTYDSLNDMLSESIDQFNDIIQDFEDIEDTLDHYQKIIELTMGLETEAGRQQMAQLYELERVNSLNKQSGLSSHIEELTKQRDEAIARGFDPDDTYIKNIEAEIREESKSLQAEIENYIDTIQAQLVNAVNMAATTMDKNLFGANISDVRQDWEDKKAKAEGYYDTVQRVYQLESLESKWKAAITSTSSLKAQQQLTDLMKSQVATLENKTALSEKDIQLAEKELAVYQAQIALEEAQNNKNSMKLTRGTDGNWSYQYVADDADVAKKQEDYINKVNEWRDASISAGEEIQESILSAYETFEDRLVQIQTDVTLSAEERAEKIAALNELYWGKEGIITKAVEDSNYAQMMANNATYVELGSLYMMDEENLQRMSETEQGIIEDFKDKGIASYNALREEVGRNYESIGEKCEEVNEECVDSWDTLTKHAIDRMYNDEDSVVNIVNNAYEEMKAALDSYKTAVKDSTDASKEDWKNVKNMLVGEDGNGGIKKDIDNIADEMQEFLELAATQDWKTYETKVLNMQTLWQGVADAIASANGDLDDFYAKLQNDPTSVIAPDQDEKQNDNDSKNDSQSNPNSNSNPDNNSSSGSGESYTIVSGDTLSGITLKKRTNPSSTWRDLYEANEDTIESAAKSHGRSNSNDGHWIYPGTVLQIPSGFDTGGYTGEWEDGNGRLALLHSKELVLNAKDTENILTAVDSVRQIASIGSSVSKLIASSIGNMVSGLIGLGKNNYGVFNKGESEAGDNIFNITAEFPNADSVETIQEAILSLPNLASQYLSRR